MKKEILKGRWAGEEMKTVRLDGKRPERPQEGKEQGKGDREWLNEWKTDS